MTGEVPLYDQFGADYDVMVDWPARLTREWPFFEKEFERIGAGDESGVQRVLDVGCATGHHAAYFAQTGRLVVAADPSAVMLERARVLAAGVPRLSFVQAAFGELSGRVGGGFDTVTCLGNTLPHALDRAALHGALADMGAVLRPGGILIIQQLNYDRICRQRQRFLGLSTGQARDEEILFFRFYDFADPLLTFNVVIVRRRPGGEWQFRAEATQLRPVLLQEVTELLAVAGFASIATYGSYNREPFDPTSSNDLILVAEKRG